jgi:host factor-I protein
MNKPQLNLQDTFLNQVRKENVGVTIYLIGGVQLRGNVRGFDSFTILLDSPGKPTQMVYKHSVTSIVPMRPIQNLYTDAIREANPPGQALPPSPTAPPTVPAAAAHPDSTVNVEDPAPMPASSAREAANIEPIS